VRVAAVLLAPYMPGSSGEILRRLGVAPDPAALRFETDTPWQANGQRSLLQGSLLWPRLEAPASAQANVDINPTAAASSATPTATKPAAAQSGGPAQAIKETSVTDQPTNPNPPAPAGVPLTQAAAPVPAADNRITIDEFMKIDLRVARVTAAERVPNSRKLVKLSIDLGNEQRTLVAGIAEAYEADTLVGRHVVIVANLKPAKLMGIESNGMVLAASPDGGKPMLVAFDAPPPLGTRVR
jgi:methionyl-tRNA synthetase